MEIDEKEANLMEHRLMTLQEQADICLKVSELRESGKKAEAAALLRTLPAPPYLAKLCKEKFGADFLRRGGWNLAEAEAEYGSDWLDR
jgi:hypothetical protein